MNTLLACAVLACVAIATAIQPSKDDKLMRRLLLALTKKDSGSTCEQGQFTCDNGNCIKGAYECDYYDDCGDQSDEEDCEWRKNPFECDDGQLIPAHWRCDGGADCDDWSDEGPLRCNPDKKSCKSDEFECSNGWCIDLELSGGYSQLCDGSDDCGDGSDELPASCPKKSNKKRYSRTNKKRYSRTVTK